MAVTLQASGTQTATIGTEHTLETVEATGVFTLHVDTVNMANGDILRLRVKQMTLTGGAIRTLFFHGYYAAQSADDYIKVSIPVGNDLSDTGAITFTLEQTHGTGRDFPWKVLKYT